MGKASRLKAERAATNETTRVSADQNGNPEKELSAAVIVVGELFGVDTDCAAAAGLLAAIGEQLGHRLRPQPLSVIIREPETETLIMMGPKATEKFSAEQLATMENLRPRGRETGHIVVISDEHNLLLDPNMRQLGSIGVNAPSIIMRVRSTEPDSGNWQFRSDALEILYLVDNENQALLPRYEDAYRESHAYAQTIGEEIVAGVDPIEIAVRMKRN